MFDKPNPKNRSVKVSGTLETGPDGFVQLCLFDGEGKQAVHSHRYPKEPATWDFWLYPGSQEVKRWGMRERGGKEIIYLVMEMLPHAWDMPRGAYETREEAESECKRLAEFQLEAYGKEWKKKGSTERMLSPEGHFMEKEARERGSREGGWAIFRGRRGDYEEGSSFPEVSYRVQEFTLGEKAEPFWMRWTQRGYYARRRKELGKR